MDATASPESISASEALAAVRAGRSPLIIDVRRRPDFREAGDMIEGALWRDPERLPPPRGGGRGAGHGLAARARGRGGGPGVALARAERGIASRYLQGGIEEGWKAAYGALDRKAAGANTRWVTRERPKVDRIACPWLVARFIDPDAEFLYVPAKEVLEAATQRDAVPYDIPGVPFSHDGERCSFDAFLKHFRLADPALDRLALVVRGADTARPDLAPQAPGLVAISLGLSRNFADDHEMLEHGMVMYDALYAWCREGQDEMRTWNPPHAVRGPRVESLDGRSRQALLKS